MMHPRDRLRKKNFGCCDDISYIPFFSSMIKKTHWVTPVAREIGLGPTLFLMTMKAFAWLFLFFFLCNIPLILFYYKGSEIANKGRTTPK